MEIAVLVFAFGIAFFVWSKTRERDRQESEDLRFFLHDAGGDPTFTSQFDLEAMRLRWSASVPWIDTQEFLVRRQSAVFWQTKLTDASAAQRLAKIDELLSDQSPAGRIGRSELESERAQLQRGPLWERMGDEITGPLETAYQRYLLRGR